MLCTAVVVATVVKLCKTCTYNTTTANAVAECSYGVISRSSFPSFPVMTKKAEEAQGPRLSFSARTSLL